jgi:hypothetical protein
VLSGNKTEGIRVSVKVVTSAPATIIGTITGVDTTEFHNSSVVTQVNGRVGINRYSPDAQLHVQGDSIIEGNLDVNAQVRCQDEYSTGAATPLR